jgi:hypothetical protein
LPLKEVLQQTRAITLFVKAIMQYSSGVSITHFLSRREFSNTHNWLTLQRSCVNACLCVCECRLELRVFFDLTQTGQLHEILRADACVCVCVCVCVVVKRTLL